MRIKVQAFLVIVILLGLLPLYGAVIDNSPNATKKFDLSKWHSVGNIWLRVSNYGFFGSGNDASPQYPSLEYPGGSGADYLYQGALWFGAKKARRNAAGKQYYWKQFPPSSTQAVSSQLVTEGDSLWTPTLVAVIDTLVTVGFDGDLSLYEFLPAYNPLENQIENYNSGNIKDQIISASVRTNRRGVDDDGDGLVDEDFPGYTFPMRASSELPMPFSSFGGAELSQLTPSQVAKITDVQNIDIWFPLGFMELADNSLTDYNFAASRDDDGDGLADEDGAPVSEQDFISYYYDYSPFGTAGDRDWGSSRSQSKHVPLNVRVRQMSYQWSYSYIKNMVYVEFDVTNMNARDTLYDCAMGIYMDSDVGPQSWGSEKATDDVSGYVPGQDLEFAYTRDADGDGGLADGLVGSRVCSPNPEEIKFSCWYWKVGDGPDDSEPLKILSGSGSKKTSNEKYYLLTGRNPNTTNWQPLRRGDDVADSYELTTPADTRYLFAFYGAQPGDATYDATHRWNLAPGRTMKIVIALFPGDNLESLKKSAKNAKEIYGIPQTLTTVILPDTVSHYQPAEPPDFPHMAAYIMNDGKAIDVYWDNRAEFSIDRKVVKNGDMGWQNTPPLVAGLDSDPNAINTTNYPQEYKPATWISANGYNNGARVNPWTAYRLRHDFQGYKLWGRSGSGSAESWELKHSIWDKIDTPQDIQDYRVNHDFGNLFLDFGGELADNVGLPNLQIATAADTMYYHFDSMYTLVKLQIGDSFNGYHLYNANVEYTDALQTQANQIAQALGEDQSGSGYTMSKLVKEKQALMFKNPNVSDKTFLELYDDALIPLRYHGGQTSLPSINGGDTTKLYELRQERLARRYYTSTINYPPRGYEYYVAVTAWDRGIPNSDTESLDSGRDENANMKVLFPGNSAKSNMDNIYVIPNPYFGRSKFDGRRENDKKGDKSKRLWFVNIPENCKIRIYTLAGDLVKEIDHNGPYQEDIITVSKAATQGITASGMHAWDLLSKNKQIIAAGVYLYSVEDKKSGDLKVGKFVVIK